MCKGAYGIEILDKIDYPNQQALMLTADYSPLTGVLFKTPSTGNRGVQRLYRFSHLFTPLFSGFSCF